MSTYLAALATAVIAGVGLGVLIGASRRANRLLTPFLDSLASVPGAAMVPLTLLLFGFTFVANVLIVVLAQWRGHLLERLQQQIAAAGGRRVVAHLRRRVAGELVVQRRQRGVAAGGDLLLQPLEQVRAPLRQVDDARREPVGMQASRSTLTGGCEQVGAAPAISSGTSALCATRFQWRSTASAG